MKRKFTAISLLFAFIFVSFIAKSQPTPPSGQVWSAVSELTDEFNDTSLDGQKWLNYHPYWLGREPSQFNSNNISLSGGYLYLKSIVSNYNQTGNWISSSCVTSKTKAMKPGYYSEARIKCPALSMTGAYWFQGNYSEIDVIENFGAPTASAFAGFETHMNTNLHYFKGGWAQDIATPWEASILKPGCADAFFTYGVWWKDATTIIFYLNGKEVHTSKTGGPFDENMYMLFDMEAYNWGIGLPTITSLDDNTKNTQYVDWVHTYKLGTGTKVSVSEVLDSEKDIRVFPNPGSGSSFNIALDGLYGNVEVSIFDFQGKLLFKQLTSEKLLNVSSNIFKAVGMYLIKAKTSENIETRKVIVK